MGSSKKDSMPLGAPLPSRKLMPATGFNRSWQCLWAFAMAASMLFCSIQLLAPNSHSKDSPSYAFNEVVPSSIRLSKSSQDPTRDSATFNEWHGDLRRMEAAWNRLCFGRLDDHLRIALFVKKWPIGGVPGGLERHALTLHRDLANRGHDVHVYTSFSPGQDESQGREVTDQGLHIHFSSPTSGGTFDYHQAWDRFIRDNASVPFDIVHSESVALPHWKAQEIGETLAASWHGIGYEIIHSELLQDVIRKPGEPRSVDLQRSLSERLGRVADEIRFFPSYRHHVATSDYVADVLQTIYQIPLRNVHTILNGVDSNRFYPDPARGSAFRLKFGVPANASFVFGAAGRLVRDKGHPLLFEAFQRIMSRYPDVFLLIAGSGPWGDRYRDLAPNVKTLGAMNPNQLADFYNALDVFVNPTLRSQGLDHTLLEAMQCGKALLATHFSSITWSVVVSHELGGTFSPNADSLEQALEQAILLGKESMRLKGKQCHEYASLMFTATKMGAAYERLFLCIKNQTHCQYPLPQDCPVQPSKY